MQAQAGHKKVHSMFSQPISQAKRQQKRGKSLSSGILPFIHNKKAWQKMSEINVQNTKDLRKQIAKVLTFKRDKVTCLQSSLYQHLSEQVQALSYNSPQYSQKLNLINKIFASCDLQLKDRDILIAVGKKTQNKYVFITNFSYHPESLCCQRQVIFKCIEKRGIELQPQYHGTKKWEIMCSACKKTILKLTQKQQTIQKAVQNYQKRRKLLDFALHIASGRFKRHLLDHQPVTLSFEHVKSKFSNVKIKNQLQN